MSVFKTGKTRYRIGFRGRVILQLQERFSIASGGYGETSHYTEWRDARAEDLTEVDNDTD